MDKRLYLVTVVGSLEEDEVDLSFPTLDGMCLDPIGAAPRDSVGDPNQGLPLEAGSTIALAPYCRDEAGRLIAVVYQAPPPLQEFHPK